MHFFKIVLALPVAGSVFAARSPIVKGGDETVVPTEPTEKELQTVDKPKRFIVEFAEVRYSYLFQTFHSTEQERY